MFCELNFIKEFISIIDVNEHNINLVIIELFSFLFVNLSTSNFFYYIMSNNFINLLISRDYNDYDYNFFSYYISFIKSLALRIDNTTIQFFYQENHNSFPLVECSLGLYNINDPMIRTCVRVILLTILQIKYKPIQDHFIQLPTVKYFIHISLHLREMIININEIKNSSNQTKWNNAYEDIVDEIKYIKDILKLQLFKINYVLINSLYHYLILPILFKTLIQGSESIGKISKEIGLIILKAFIDNIEDEHFSYILYYLLFSNRDISIVLEFMKQLEKNQEVDYGKKYYYSNWVKQKENKETFIDLISKHYTPGFFMSLIFENNINYSIYKQKYFQLQKLQEKVKNYIEKNISLTSTMIEEMIHEYFKLEDYKSMKDYHESVSNTIGIKVGLLASEEKEIELSEPCFLSTFKAVYQKNKRNNLTKVNDIKMRIYEYINIQTNCNSNKNNQSLTFFSCILLYSGIKKHIVLMMNQNNIYNKIQKQNKEQNELKNQLMCDFLSTVKLLKLIKNTHYELINQLFKVSFDINII